MVPKRHTCTGGGDREINSQWPLADSRAAGNSSGERRTGEHDQLRFISPAGAHRHRNDTLTNCITVTYPVVFIKALDTPVLFWAALG